MFDVNTKSELEPLMQKLISEKEAAFNFQKRRHDEWDENYTLYRNKVIINRLTQRQSVNIPIMKETVKTLLARLDDPPDVVFQELNNNKEKEIILNELWNHYYDILNFEGLDVQDKKNVLLYGRTFKKLNFLNGDFDCDVLDVKDVLIDPKVNPLNIDTARYLIHQNIFRTLREILADEKYNEEGKKELRNFLLTKEGIVLDDQNREFLEEKIERLKTMGAGDYADLEEILGSGDVIVALSEHYSYLWDEKEKQFKLYVMVYADDNILLFKKPLKEVLGIDFYPFVSWADDLETLDFWSDGVADIVRIPNKILNAWFSQLVENRTLRNWGMQFFDATHKDWLPQSFEAQPWGWYPVPGNPNELIKRVDVPDLKESLPEMEYLTKIIERATAATAIEKGITEKKQITLGEVELLAGRAIKRIVSTIKIFYRRAWKEFAMKWYKILDANVVPSQTIKIYKMSYKGNFFKKEAKPKDWKSKAGYGYKVKVTSSSEQMAETTSEIQKLIAIRAQFPENLALQKIIQKRILEIAKLTPEEIKEITAFEEEKMKETLAPSIPLAPIPSPSPKVTAETEDEESIKRLKSLRNTIGKALTYA